MNVKETKVEGLKHSFEIVVLADEIAENLTKKIKEIGETATIPGFRKGKAPESFLRQRYEGAAMGEVVEELIQSESTKVLSDNKLRPAHRPNVNVISFDKGKDLVFTMDFEAIPEITPIDFSKISLEKMIADVDEKEIEKTLQRLAESRKDSKKVEENRAAVKGDIAVIDFVGSVDGVEFQGGKGNAYPLELGSNSFIPGYEDQIIGHKVGDKFDVNVKFPENYGAKDLAGKNAVFAVEIKELREKKTVELNDEFAKFFGKEKLDEVREMVRMELSHEYESVSMDNLKKTLLDKLADAHDFPVPEIMANEEFDAIWKQIETAKSKNSLDAEDVGKTDDELKIEYKSIAERRVRLGLLLAEIGAKNNISVTDADLNRAIMMEARQFPGQEKAVFDFYAKHPEMLDRLRAPLFEDKVVDFILKGVSLTEKKVSPEDLYKVGISAEKSDKKDTKKNSKPKKETKTDGESKKSSTKKKKVEG